MIIREKKEDFRKRNEEEERRREIFESFVKVVFVLFLVLGARKKEEKGDNMFVCYEQSSEINK